MITFDRSARSVVTSCSCGARDVFTSQGAADNWAVDHLLKHATSDDKSRAIASLTRRHARNAG